MSKVKWLKRVNVLLFLFLLFQAVTAMSSGVISGDVFEVIHPIGGGILFVFALVHLGLNWGWVRSVILGKKA
jgi:hypothetical protein